MAEFHFYGTRNDWPLIAKAVLAVGGLALTPDRLFPTDCATTFTSFESDLIPPIPDFHEFRITGTFSTRGIELFRLSKGEREGMYAIDESSGPLLKLTLPDAREHPCLHNLKHMGRGCLFMNTSFYDPVHHAVDRQSDSLKAAYKQCVRAIRSTVTRMAQCRKILIGPHGRSLLENDEAVVLIDGAWHTGHGEMLMYNLPRPMGDDAFMRQLSDAARKAIVARKCGTGRTEE